MIGQIEGLLKGEGGNSPVQDLDALRIGMLLAGNEERILSLNEFDLIGPKASERHNDLILVLAPPSML